MYIIMYFVFLESFFLVFVVYIVFVFFFLKKIWLIEIIGPYECGFDCVSSTRLVFSYRFFLISILFIIFDVEISLMVSVPFFMVDGVGLSVFFIFIFILIVGLVYEYYYGSLDWLDYQVNKND